MKNLKQASYNAWKWCSERHASHWSRSHFNDKLKCDILLNNHSESFNKSVLEARKKPIIPCLEDIRIATMVRLNNRRNSAAKWRCKVGPRIEKLLRKNATWSHDYKALESSEQRFELQGRGAACESGVISQHSVQLDMQSCTCRRWDLSGLPCGHVIAALYSKGWSPDDFVSEWYTKRKYLEAYEVAINPIAGVAEWDKKERPIAPPLYRRQRGRPKTKRTKAPGEEPPPAGIDRLSKSYYSQMTCGTCHKKGHNKRTCKKRNQGLNAVGEPQVAYVVPQMVNENQNVNLNINLDVNPNIDSRGDDGTTMFSQNTSNVMNPGTESNQTRRSPRLAAASASASASVQAPKSKLQRALWKT